MIPSDRFYLSLQSRRSESELGEGGFIVSLLVVAAVAQVAPFLRLSAWQLAAARRIHLENNRPVLPRWPFPFVENDTPDAAVPFAPTLGDSLYSTILPFLDDGARHRIIVELNGGVGARVVVAGKSITGAFNIEPVRFAASLVDGAHDAFFDVRCDGSRAGGVLVGKVIHGVFAFLWRLFSSGPVAERVFVALVYVLATSRSCGMTVALVRVRGRRGRVPRRRRRSGSRSRSVPLLSCRAVRRCRARQPRR